MRSVRWVFILAVAAAAAQPLAAQLRQPLDSPQYLASWMPAIPAPTSSAVGIRTPPLTQDRRVERTLIGGLIGAAVGAIVCTAISNIADDAARDRFTTCTAGGYLLFSGGGFVLGALIGAATD